MIIARDRIRIAIDPQDEDGVVDLVTEARPRAWRGMDLQFEFGFFFDGQWVTPSNFDSVIVYVKAGDDRGGATLMQKEISAADLDVDLEEEDWNAGTLAHCIVPFTGEETALDLKGEDEREFFMFIYAISNDATPRRIPLGQATFVIEDAGLPVDDAPVFGGTILPVGAAYSGAGAYALSVTAGQPYHWSKGTNDTNLVNGTETLTSSGTFIAQGASVTLNGTASAQITAVIRTPGFYTAAEIAALHAGRLKIINEPGVLVGTVSPSGTYLRLLGVDDNGDPIDEIRSLVS